MFTGIIEGLGTVTGITPAKGGVRFDLRSDFALTNLGIGASVAVNGVCLTAIDIRGNAFSVEAAPETLSKSTMGHLKRGDSVNLERALKLGDRLDGHLVTGHIDGVGSVSGKRREGNAILFSFAVPQPLSRLIVQKGSVAVDGISLTVNTCSPGGFQVSVIPHTAEVTSLRFRNVGDAVNIETDIIGKYVDRFTRNAAGKPAGGDAIDEALLARAGFL